MVPRTLVPAGSHVAHRQIGMETKSLPFGLIEAPVNPIALALTAGAALVAPWFQREPGKAFQYKGFSFLDVFSPCAT